MFYTSPWLVVWKWRVPGPAEYIQATFLNFSLIICVVSSCGLLNYKINLKKDKTYNKQAQDHRLNNTARQPIICWRGLFKLFKSVGPLAAGGTRGKMEKR